MTLSTPGSTAPWMRSSFLHVSNRESGLLIRLVARGATVRLDQLPRQVIERAAQVVRHVADDGGVRSVAVQRDGPVDLEIATVRLYNQPRRDQLAAVVSVALSNEVAE